MNSLAICCRSMSVAVAVLAGALVGCGGAEQVLETPEGMLEEKDGLGQIEAGLETQLTVTPFEDPLGVGGRAGVERRIVITSAAQYQQYFGHPAPSVVDFTQNEAVIFYAAGPKSTGGYAAKIGAASLSPTGRVLHVTTQLVSPGPDCFVTQATSNPYVLAKVSLQPGTRWVRWSKNDVVELCNDYNPCAATLCEVGTTCEVRQPQCLTTPCDSIAVCVPNKPAPFCGGFAGIQCPGAGTCKDDPSDSCDPNNGGADCGGRCVCEAGLLGRCQPGYVPDNSPEVCACVPEGSVPPPSR